jgi:hypothetical protein
MSRGVFWHPMIDCVKGIGRHRRGNRLESDNATTSLDGDRNAKNEQDNGVGSNTNVLVFYGCSVRNLKLC